jgi:hypothetical protein
MVHAVVSSHSTPRNGRRAGGHAAHPGVDGGSVARTAGHLILWYNRPRTMSTPDHRRSAVSHPQRRIGRHVGADIILCAAPWYLRSVVSDGGVGARPRERGMMVDYTAVCRGVRCEAPELDQRRRPPPSATSDSCRVNPGLGCGRGSTAPRPSRAMTPGTGSVQARVINQLFGLTAPRACAQPLLTRRLVLATRP